MTILRVRVCEGSAQQGYSLRLRLYEIPPDGFSALQASSRYMHESGLPNNNNNKNNNSNNNNNHIL